MRHLQLKYLMTAMRISGKQIHAGQPCYEIFKGIAGEGLTESTLKWRLRKLTALAKKTEKSYQTKDSKY